MPMYDTQCDRCSKQEVRKLSFEQYEGVGLGSVVLECLCGGRPALVFDPSAVNFVLKDGESGGWATKAGKENKYRAARGDLMSRRTRDHVKPTRLIPNFKGEIAHSWTDARDAAYQSTYERVRREHGSRDAAHTAAASAQTYDAHVKQEVSP